MRSKGHNGSRVVLISGAGSGIGEALAREFARNQCVVMGCGRNVSRLDTVKKKIQSEGGIFFPIRCDVRNEKSIHSAGKKISSIGDVDILVNNAGSTYFKDFASTTTKEFDEVMETNLKGMFLLTKLVLPSMLRRQKGLVINVLSYAAKTVYTGSSIYSASKSAGASMMSVLREEIRNRNVKVLNVYPGATLTEMWSAKNRSRFSHRMMQTVDIARFIVETASLPESMMVEEIVFRPQQGDLRI